MRLFDGRIDRAVERTWRFILRLPQQSCCYHNTDLFVKSFHEQSRRERIATAIHRSLFSLSLFELISQFRRWINKRISQIGFSRARVFTYRSHHYIYPDNIAVDGTLEFRWGLFKCSVGCSVISYQVLVADAMFSGYGGLDLSECAAWGDSTLLVPEEDFTIEQLKTVVSDWYIEKMRFKYRHFTSRGEMPIIQFDLKVYPDSV